jgi:hypothetical protein
MAFDIYRIDYTVATTHCNIRTITLKCHNSRICVFSEQRSNKRKKFVRLRKSIVFYSRVLSITHSNDYSTRLLLV